MKKVCILLATYNGKPYIEQQLESIFAQTVWDDCTLFVRDDGSTDGTLDILKKYEQEKKLTLAAGENIGYVKNFFWLIHNAPRARFYAFCDQDDIWNAQKLSRALSVLESFSAGPKKKTADTDSFGAAFPSIQDKTTENATATNQTESEPLLYCSDYDYFFTDSGKTVRAQHHTLKPSFASAMTINIAAGFTCVINNALKEKLSQLTVQHGMYHDYAAYLTALLFGSVLYDDFSSALYRRHENTETKTASSAVDFLTYMVKRYILGTIKNDKLLTIQAIKEAFQGELSPCKEKLLGLFTSHSIASCVKKCFYPHRYRDSLLSDASIRVLMLCNRF